MRLILFSLSLLLLCTPAYAFTPPPVEEVTASGITAWMVEDNSLPVFSLIVRVKHAGAAYDPEGKSGLSTLATRLLDEGAGNLTSQQFKTELEERGIEFSARNDDDDVVITLRSLSSEADAALRLVGLALSQPRYDEEAFLRMKTASLTNLKLQAENPESAASLLWTKTALGNHPYARNVRGTEKGLNAITIADLKAYAKTHYGKSRLQISAAGNITQATLSALLSKHLGALQAGAPAKDLAPLPQWKPATAYEKRDLPQTILRFGLPAIDVGQPDYYAMALVNYTLGGWEFFLTHDAGTAREKGASL